MNKLLLSFAIASALGLAGCGGESLDEIKEDTQTGGEVQIPLSRVVYDPANGVLSPPNDLLLQGTTDGTLFMPTEKNAAGLHLDAPNYADPSTALGALDGWSTQNPFTIALSFTSGVTLDPVSVRQASSVHLVETLMGDPASPDADCRAVPRGAACKTVDSLTFGVDFVAQASGNNIAVIPLKPLKPATTYILVFTNDLKDSEGRSIAASSTYELVKQDIATKPLGTAAQLALQGVINSFENALTAESINKADIIYTAAITTQSTAPVFDAVKLLLGSKVQTAMTNKTPLLSLANSGDTVQDRIAAPGNADPRFQAALVYEGSVQLPYYLAVPTTADPRAPLNVSWKARCDSGAIIATLTEQQKTALKATITDPVQNSNDDDCNALSGGALRDFGLDKQRHLTKFNTLPKETAELAVPVLVTVPNEALTGRTKPAAGWPVVIMQHGITSKKEDMLAITATLAGQGFATIAIDHPLHGERGFGPINASSRATATVYMNLSNLLVTRDNLRQSIADILAVRIGLHATNLPGLLNRNDVQFLGLSLGSITGASAVALANTPLGRDSLDPLFRMSSAALSVPGGAVANFLMESVAFGDTIKANVLIGAGGTTAESYTNFATTQNGCGGSNASPYPSCFKPFIQYLNSIDRAADVAAINAALAQFVFAAQTVTDAGDPNNFAAKFVATQTPAYIAEVVGGGDNLPDQVIPNRAAAMPLAGTEPLARLLGAVAVNNVAGSYPVTGTAISRFTAGEHGSLLLPIVPAVTVEMQTQVASFFTARGAGLQVANGAVMAPAN